MPVVCIVVFVVDLRLPIMNLPWNNCSVKIRLPNEMCCKECVLVLQLGSTVADNCNELECDHIFYCVAKKLQIKTNLSGKN